MKYILTTLIALAAITSQAQNINRNNNADIINMNTREEVSRPSDWIMMQSRGYNAIWTEIDFTATDELLAVVTRHSYNKNEFPGEVVASLDSIRRVFSIKGIDSRNYIAGEKESGATKRYFVYTSGENDRERAIVKALALALQEKLAEAARRAEAERQFILAHPWPHKTVFRGQSYTRTAYPNSEQGVQQNNYGEKLGVTTYFVRPEGAYPPDFVWKEGYSLHQEGTVIHAIKGIDPKYYLLVWGEIYANDNGPDAALDEKVRKISEEAHDKLEAARKLHTLLRQLGYNGFSENTSRILADIQYPASTTAEPNENIKIISVWAHTRDYAHWQRDQIPDGFFEIDFGNYYPQEGFDPFGIVRERDGKMVMLTKRMTYFHKQENGSYVLERTGMDGRLKYLPNEGSYYSKLFSQLIDNRIHEKAEQVSHETNKYTAGYITLCFADGSYKRIPVSNAPKSCMDAFENLLITTISSL